MSAVPSWDPASLPLPHNGFLADLLECVAEGVIAADLEGRFVLFNSSAQRMLGLGPHDVPSDQWTEKYGIFLEDTVTPFPPEQVPLARAIRGETVEDCLVHIRNPNVPDGLWINVSGAPLRDKDGLLYGGVAVFREVTGERRTLERTRLLSAVAEQTADAVMITDRLGVIEYVNPAVEKMTGFAPDELVGKTPRVLRSGLHTNADYAAMWDTLMKGDVFRGTLINRKKADGAIYYSEQTITPIRDSAGRVSRFVSVGKDLTEVRASLERSNKLDLARSYSSGCTRILLPATADSTSPARPSPPTRPAATTTTSSGCPAGASCSPSATSAGMGSTRRCTWSRPGPCCTRSGATATNRRPTSSVMCVRPRRRSPGARRPTI